MTASDTETAEPGLQTPETALCGRIGPADLAVTVHETEGWRARRDTPRFPLPKTIEDWEADPLQDRNWRFQLHSWRPVGPYIVAYDRLGDDSLLKKAVGLCLSWRAAEAVTETPDLYWNDMGAGIRAAKLGFLLHHAPKVASLTQAERDGLQALADQHIAKLTDDAFLGSSNHALFQLHGLMALVQAMPGHPLAERGRAFLLRALPELLKSQFGEEGMHLEHSPGYHLFVTRTLRKLLASGWYGDMPFTQAAIKRADRAFAWLVFPDGSLSSAGDSDRGGRTYAYKLEPDQPSRLLREAGYAVVRGPGATAEDGSMLFVTAGHHSNVHKHADDLSFELYDRGRFWVIDTGKYSYSKELWRQYTDSARAHNTVAYSPRFPGNAVKRTPPVGGMLTDLRQVGDEWIVDGRVERIVAGTVHDRRFRYQPGRRLIIEDRLQFDTPRETWAWLHLAPDLEAVRTGAGWRLPGAEIRYAVEGSEWELHRVRGQLEPEYQGWMADGYHKLTPNDALGVKLSGTAISLVTTISFD